jgi:hypothetical protein
VLIVGDEDCFEPIWVPRLCAAGADLTKLRTLEDGEYLDDLIIAERRLAAAIESDGIGLVLFDQLLDHVPGGVNGEAIYNPKNVRQAMAPLRPVAAERGVAALGLLHPIKGNAPSFRQLVAGSHQFNAVSRSSLLLAADPEDESRRVLVRGKGNHSAAPRSFEFKIAADVVELNGHTFEVPKVVDAREGERSAQDLMKTGTSEAPVREKLAKELEPLLTPSAQSRAALARAVDRDPKDGSVLNALKWLEEQGRATRGTSGGWRLPGQVQGATP